MDPLPSDLDLTSSDRFMSRQNLSVKIRQNEYIIVHQIQSHYASARKRLNSIAPDSAQSENRDPATRQFL